MASPQLKHGYTRIANEILRAFMRLSINGTQFRLLCVILKQTYGWGKTVDRIALSQFEDFTGILNRSLISRELKKLEKRRIIEIERGQGQINFYRFNKDYEQWQDYSLAPDFVDEGVIQSGNTGIAQSDKGGVTQSGDSGAAQPETHIINQEERKGLKEKWTEEKLLSADAHPSRLRPEERRILAEQVRDYYYDAYKKNKGEEYPASSDRNIRPFNRLVKKVSVKELKRRIDQLFWLHSGDFKKDFTVSGFARMCGVLGKAKDDSPVAKEQIEGLRNHLNESFRKKFKEPRVGGEAGKDRGVFRDLLKEDSVDVLHDLIDRLFIIKDRYITESNYSTALFKSQIDKLKRFDNQREEYAYSRPPRFRQQW